MKYTVNKKDLNEAVSNVMRAVSSKTSIQALEGILMCAKDGGLELTAYDLELGIKTTIATAVAEEGSIVLSAKLFSEIVRKAPADTLTVSADEKNICTIISGSSNFTIVGINAQEFPELPQVGGDQILTVSGDIIKGMIRQTIFAVAESDAKPIHQGSLFTLEDGILDIVSVDGYRFALRRENIAVSGKTSFVVPGKTLSEVLKLCGDEDVEIMPGRRHIMFKIGSYTIVSGILEGEFLDYKSVIPKESSTSITVRTRDFIESTERVSLLITDRLRSPLRCTFSDGEIRLACSTAMGRATDEFPCAMEGPELEMGFNNKYLLDALKYTECDEIQIRMSGPLNPMVIVPKEGDSFLFLVLPVRLKTE